MYLKEYIALISFVWLKNKEMHHVTNSGILMQSTTLPSENAISDALLQQTPTQKRNEKKEEDIYNILSHR